MESKKRRIQAALRCDVIHREKVKDGTVQKEDYWLHFGCNEMDTPMEQAVEMPGGLLYAGCPEAGRGGSKEPGPLRRPRLSRR